MISSAKHSATVFIDLKVCSLQPTLSVCLTVGNQVDSLVDTSHGRYVYCLLSNNTSRSDSCGVLSRTSGDDCPNEYFEWVSASEQVDDFKSVAHDSDGLNLLSCVPAVELEGTDEPLNDWAGCLSEGLLLVAASSVRDEHVGFIGVDGDIIDEALVVDLSGWRGTFTGS